MDLHTMTSKCDRGDYKNPSEFELDLNLIFTNAKTYNNPSSIYHKEATRLSKLAVSMMTREFKIFKQIGQPITITTTTPQRELRTARQTLNYSEDKSKHENVIVGKKKSSKENHKVNYELKMLQKFNPDGTLVAVQPNSFNLSNNSNNSNNNGQDSTNSLLWETTPFQEWIDSFSVDYYCLITPPSEIELASIFFFLYEI